MPRHQGAKVEHFDVSNMIYHKFSHGSISYRLNWEDVKVVLEFAYSSMLFQIYGMEEYCFINSTMSCIISAQ